MAQKSSAESLFRRLFPKRRWVVESRPSMFPKMAWSRSLGPYRSERTARDMMRRCRWFDHGLVAWRVRDLEADRG